MDIVVNCNHPGDWSLETPLTEADNITTTALPPKYMAFSSHGSFYHHFFQSLGYQTDSPPIADLLRRYYGLEGRWVIASPAHFQTTHNDAMITGYGEALGLSAEMSRCWFERFSEFTALDEMSTYYVDADTWLIRCDEKPKLYTASVHQVLNCSLMPQLESMDQTLYWQKFVTESQMYINHIASNQHHHNASLVNGLWVWGDGDLQQAAPLNAPTQRTVFCQNESLFKMTRLITDQVVMYQPEVHSPSAHDLFLFECLDMHELKQLEIKLIKFKTNWYWNNLAYTIKRAGWLSRLWSRYAN